ncbi:MAG: nucleoside triphosphate pyrophosphohydrolase [Alphaproteobacteria bacterium]|nr:nucleoside triphosphate pyrophosphohydrolase [Alphaproteobacteria bacterium]
MPKIAIKQDTEFTSPIEKLKWVMECLRDPENGCPWDREQNFKSILPYTIEEAYEVADAIENGSIDDLKEELGDLLLQVIYHAQIACESGHFTFDNVAQAVADKMISRHPHVFGDANAKHAADVNVIWDQQKEKEKSSQSALGGVAKGLPALLRAQKLQKKAAKIGFEWKNPDGAFRKVEEEISEFKNAKTPKEKEEEFGDLLIALANYARMEGINAEEALRKANDKFQIRFQGMETECADRGVNFKDLTLEEMLEYWARQKGKIKRL